MNGTRAREVWVFGAGIAGLTAAHELAERGFKVTVIEKEPDVRFFGEPAVGGMAKTQWAIAEKPGTEPSSTRPVFNVRRARFTVDSSEPLDWNIEGLVDDLRKLYGGDIPPLRVIGFRQQEEAERLPQERAEAVATQIREKLGSAATITASGILEPDATYAEVEVGVQVVPGEHGFRYFPSFYWHTFDTMRRIRLLEKESRPSPVRIHTVLDNLVSTEEVTLASVRGGLRVEGGRGSGWGRGGRSSTVSRRRPGSVREVVELIRAILKDLGHEPSDVAHLASRLARFVTSGPSRRATYEAMTFADFLQKDKLSRRCAQDLENAPEVLGGMRASEADALTQGNVSVQLLLGDMRRTGIVDATLNGPTSSVWFLPWREYLQRVHEVDFLQGKLTGFKADDAKQRVLPVVELGAVAADPSAAALFVLALDLPAFLPKETQDPGRLQLCEAFLEALNTLSVPEGARVRKGDFADLQEWIRCSDWRYNARTRAAAEAGPMRHLAGLQLFFDTNQQPTTGHTIFLDAPWRLSSIAQPSFWSVPQERNRPLGIISVDIGEWYTPQVDPFGEAAWECAPGDIQKLAWQQMTATFPAGAPAPLYFHLDQGIDLADSGEYKGRPLRNRTPYLITRPQDWPLRPGTPGAYGAAGVWKDGKLAAGGWVLAGTFMKTHTRLTSMESANESARHAVNALLQAIGSDAPACVIRTLEQDEPPELKALKDLDERLFQEGLPHMMDTLRVDDWLDSLALGST